MTNNRMVTLSYSSNSQIISVEQNFVFHLVPAVAQRELLTKTQSNTTTIELNKEITKVIQNRAIEPVTSLILFRPRLRAM